MFRKYFLKMALVLLALSGAMATAGVHAQPAVAEGPYIVNFLDLASQAAALSEQGAPTVIHRHEVPGMAPGVAAVPSGGGGGQQSPVILQQTASPLPAI